MAVTVLTFSNSTFSPQSALMHIGTVWFIP